LTSLLADVFDTVIVRFGGEIGIKAPWTRKQYERRLASNIKAALKHYNITYSTFLRKPGRIYIKTLQTEKTAKKVSRVFGVSSLSPALETSSKLDDVLDSSLRLAKSRFAKGKSFAVRCHRVGKHPYTSKDICTQVGKRLLTSLPELKLRVNLKHPDQTLQVEVREERAYLFTHTIKGAGGLPLGTQPKLVCLLKGDVQSTVACWMTMKRGCPPMLVHIEKGTTKFQKDSYNVKQAGRTLMKWNIGFPKKLRITRFRSNSLEKSKEQPSELATIICKRLMLRTAQRIAEAENAEGIVTGDVLGKRATQAVHSFRIQDEAVRGFPIYRPLVGLDEAEIAATAKAIGLKETVKKEVEHTKLEAILKLKEIKGIERKLNTDKLAEETIKSLRTLKL